MDAPAAASMSWWKAKALPYLRGALRSWTIHFNTYFGLLWAALPSLQEQFPQLQPYLPAKPYQYGMAIVIIGNLLLRIKTQGSLADKGKGT